MTDGHLALLVEDDVKLAAQIQEALACFGDSCIHVTSREEALAELRSRDFCYMLLDLEIKGRASSISSDIVAGLDVIIQTRQLLGPPLERNCDALQILVMSAYAVESDQVVKAMQLGANDFLKKPLSKNSPPLFERIRAALERAGRLLHSLCGLRKAAAPGARPPAPEIPLELTGELEGDKTGMLVNGKPVFAPIQPLEILVKLLRARVAGLEWLDAVPPPGTASSRFDEFLGEKKNEVEQRITRLRALLKPHVPEGVKPVENDYGKGRYRLHPRIQLVGLNAQAFKSHPSVVVQKIVRRILSSGSLEGPKADRPSGD